MKFAPYYPVLPFKLNQAWGTFDPKDYSQFGYDRHNGVDAAIGSDKVVRAPFDGVIVRIGDQPTGGGIFCGLLSTDDYEFDAFTCKTPEGLEISFPAETCLVLMDFLHMESLNVVEGTIVKTGDVLGIQDNTGFSTGPHTHIQPRREILKPIAPGQTVNPAYRVLGDNYLEDVDKNDANNTFDPTSFWNGKYAASIPVAEQVIQHAAKIVNETSTGLGSPADKNAILAEVTKIVEYIEHVI